MADSYHIIDGQVVPFHGGRKDTNTGAWRDATPLELQLQEQLAAAEEALAEAAAALEAAREDAERYRWLRSRVDWKRPGDESPWTTPSGVYLVATMVSAVYGNCDEQTDAAIDQARGKGVAE